MSQHYSDPARESDPHALPDIEVFQAARTCEDHQIRETAHPSCHECAMLCGWYWWSCSPGCLPDGEVCGPFATEQEALDDAAQLRPV